MHDTQIQCWSSHDINVHNPACYEYIHQSKLLKLEFVLTYLSTCVKVAEIQLSEQVVKSVSQMRVRYRFLGCCPCRSCLPWHCQAPENHCLYHVSKLIPSNAAEVIDSIPEGRLRLIQGQASYRHHGHCGSLHALVPPHTSRVNIVSVATMSSMSNSAAAKIATAW